MAKRCGDCWNGTSLTSASPQGWCMSNDEYYRATGNASPVIFCRFEGEIKSKSSLCDQWVHMDEGEGSPENASRYDYLTR
jgi:hypothetical protein